MQFLNSYWLLLFSKILHKVYFKEHSLKSKVPFWCHSEITWSIVFRDVVSVYLLMTRIRVFLVTGTLVNAMSRIFHKLCTESFYLSAKDRCFSRFLDAALWIQENIQQQSYQIYGLRRQNWKLLYSLRNYKIETLLFHMFFSWNSFLEYVLFSKLETFYKLKKTVKNYSKAWKIARTLVSVYVPCKKKMHRNFEIPSIPKSLKNIFHK